MKHLLVVASLACALPSQTAVAARAKPPLLAVHYGSETPAPTRTVELYSSGAWVSTTFAADGTPTSTSRGHLGREQFKQVRAALTVAPWDATESTVACFAYSPTYTQYVLYGDVMFTDRACGGQTVDDITSSSIATLEGILAAL